MSKLYRVVLVLGLSEKDVSFTDPLYWRIYGDEPPLVVFLNRHNEMLWWLRPLENDQDLLTFLKRASHIPFDQIAEWMETPAFAEFIAGELRTEIDNRTLLRWPQLHEENWDESVRRTIVVGRPSLQQSPYVQQVLKELLPGTPVLDINGNDIDLASEEVAAEPKPFGGRPLDQLYIEEFVDEEMGTRVLNSLKRAEITTVAELVGKSPAQLRGLPFIGKGSMDLIIAKLAREGLVLFGEPPIFRGADPQDILLEELDLGVRTYNCLERAGCHWVSDVLAKSEGDLQAIPNFGQKSIDELVKELARHGWKLRDA